MKMLSIVNIRVSFRVDFSHISILTYNMLFVPMFFMFIMYMLCFCTLCSYATCEWPEFYINKDMLCSVLPSESNSRDLDQASYV